MAVVPPRRAIWDLAHAAGLSTAPSLILIVSEYTSYILNNLAGLDVWDYWRWALAPPENGIYSPVVEDSEEWSLVQEAAEAFQTEMVEVGTVPISTVLYAESYSFQLTNQGPGNVVIEGPLVPDGEVWRIENFWIWVSAAIPARCVIGLSGEQATWAYRAATLPIGYTAEILSISAGYNSRVVFDLDGVPAATSINGGFNYCAIPVG
jgi:hypothetical protein